MNKDNVDLKATTPTPSPFRPAGKMLPHHRRGKGSQDDILDSKIAKFKKKTNKLTYNLKNIHSSSGDFYRYIDSKMYIPHNMSNDKLGSGVKLP